MVEAQHRVSTMKLVDDFDEQRTLEELLDASKPPVPSECRHLDYLLFTPFRYAARGDSRFRRAGRTPGVFYAAERIETSVAEVAFWRLLFFIESPGLPWPSNPLEFTGFVVRYKTALCVDLTQPPYAGDAERWTHPTDYTACHAVADEARNRGATAIRSESARDPDSGYNISLLSCSAFDDVSPQHRSSWHLMLSPTGVYARCESPAKTLIFDRSAFDADPRITAFEWVRD
jgi:hypothetical protein